MRGEVLRWVEAELPQAVGQNRGCLGFYPGGQHPGG